jgi:hypothetical protein
MSKSTHTRPRRNAREPDRLYRVCSFARILRQNYCRFYFNVIWQKYEKGSA